MSSVKAIMNKIESKGSSSSKSAKQHKQFDLLQERLALFSPTSLTSGEAKDKKETITTASSSSTPNNVNNLKKRGYAEVVAGLSMKIQWDLYA